MKGISGKNSGKAKVKKHKTKGRSNKEAAKSGGASKTRTLADELQKFMSTLSREQQQQHPHHQNAEEDGGDLMDDEVRELVQDVRMSEEGGDVLLGGDNAVGVDDEIDSDPGVDGGSGEEDGEEDGDDDGKHAGDDDGKHARDDESDMDEGELERMLEEEDEADAEAAEGEQHGGGGKEDGQKQKKKTALTKQRINSWISILRKTQNLSVLKKLLLAFYLAAHEGTPRALFPKQKKTLASIPYYFKRDEQYLRVIIATLKYSTGVFQYYCDLDHDGTEDKGKAHTRAEKGVEDLMEKKKFPNAAGKGYQMVSGSIKHFLVTLLHLFKTSKDQVVLTYALKFLPEALHYFASMKVHSRKLLRQMLNLLGHEEELIRFRALGVIRQMAILYPYPFLDLCFKGVYYTLVKNALDYNARKFQVVEFLKSAIVELYGLDLNRAYHHAFICIRELAITLRRALEPKAHSYTLVYNWRFVNCMDTWCKMICTYHSAGEVSDLAYPLVQILIGMCQVQHSAKYVPALFKILQMRNTIARNVSTFVPMGATVMDLFDKKEFSSFHRKRSPKPIDTDFSLRVSKQSMSTKDFQDYMHDEAIFAILDYLQIYNHSISFPEIAYPLLRFIKHSIKKGSPLPNHGVNKLKNLAQKIAETSLLISKKRVSMNMSVQDMAKRKEGDKYLSNFIEDKTPLDEMHERMSTLRAEELLERVKAKLRHDKLSKMGDEMTDEDDDKDDDDDGEDNGDEVDSKDIEDVQVEKKKQRQKKKQKLGPMKRPRNEFDVEDDPAVDGAVDNFFKDDQAQVRHPARKKPKLSQKKLKKKASKAKDKVRTISLSDI